MQKRTILYIPGHSCSAGTSDELDGNLRQSVEDRGDIVVATFFDHDAQGRRKKGWNALIGGLDGVDRIAVASAGDLPGRTVHDLLRLLETLRSNGVGLFLLTEAIDTASGSGAVLDLIAAYRGAKLSQAIRRGQERARAAGKTIGRPVIPPGVRHRIMTALAAGGGIRPTARKLGVSPASVVNIRRSMAVIVAEAA